MSKYEALWKWIAENGSDRLQLTYAQKDKFTGRTAQIIQHELDHVNGVLI